VFPTSWVTQKACDVAGPGILNTGGTQAGKGSVSMGMEMRRCLLYEKT